MFNICFFYLASCFLAFWSEIDGITHIVFLSCSFAIRDIFFFAHYGFLQVRQVCARRKLAHPRIVASLQCRVRHVFRSKAMGQSVDCPIFQFISGKTGSLAFRRFSRAYSFRILAVSSHRLLFGSSGLPYCGKLAHPRYVALLHNRAMIPSFAPKQRDSQSTVPLLWSERRDSNPQQPAWEAGILPLNYFRIACRYYITIPFILQ